MFIGRISDQLDQESFDFANAEELKKPNGSQDWGGYEMNGLNINNAVPQQNDAYV